MVWGCFAASALECFASTDGAMNSALYQIILKVTAMTFNILLQVRHLTHTLQWITGVFNCIYRTLTEMTGNTLPQTTEWIHTLFEATICSLWCTKCIFKPLIVFVCLFSHKTVNFTDTVPLKLKQYKKKINWIQSQIQKGEFVTILYQVQKGTLPYSSVTILSFVTITCIPGSVQLQCSTAPPLLEKVHF